MAFYNSGIRRLFKKKNLNTERNTVEIEQLKKNEIADDATVAGMTSFPGFGSVAGKAIEGTQQTYINTTYTTRIKMYQKVLTWPAWQALANITTTGYAFTEENAPNLRTDQIIAMRLETYQPETEAKTPVDIGTNILWYFNPAGSFSGSSSVDNVLFKVPFWGEQMDNEAGVHISQPSMAASYSKSVGTECNMKTSEVERLAVKISGTTEGGTTNKVRLVIYFTTDPQTDGGTFFDYSS